LAEWGNEGPNEGCRHPDTKDAAAAGDTGAAFVVAWRTAVPTSLGSRLQRSSSVLSLRPWELNERLQGLGAVSLRGMARELGRNVKRLHADMAIVRDWVWVSQPTYASRSCPTTSWALISIFTRRLLVAYRRGVDFAAPSRVSTRLLFGAGSRLLR
jgi:hypothetical protein